MSSPLNQNRNMTCEICFKTLSSKQNLKQHMNTHTGDKPFSCKFPGCGVSFRHASQLSNHRTIHLGDRKVEKPQFDSFKDFIFLVIKTLESETKTAKIPSGPYKKTDAKLPPIVAKVDGKKVL